MKNILKIIFVFFLLFSFNTIIKADITDFSGGSAGSMGGLGSGQWTDIAVGIKVSILSSDNAVKDVEIFLNSNGKYSSKFSASNKPKNHQGTDITWIDSSSITTYMVSFLPYDWLKSDNSIENLYSILTSNNYTNLKKIIEHESLKSSTGPGDYIVVEPMTRIAGYYGTAYELSNAFKLTSDCGVEKSFCWMYTGAVFSGSKSHSNGGIFYNTMYLRENVSEINLMKYSSTGDSYSKRRECFMSSTCGLGIGVFKYNDIYKKSTVTIKKVRQGTTETIKKQAIFEIRKGTNCSGEAVLFLDTNGDGIDSDELEPGTYSVFETVVPAGYNAPKDSCVVKSFSVQNGESKILTIENSSNCDAQLQELKSKYGSSIPEENLKNLFLMYPTYNGLLNFSAPKCEVVTCGITDKIKITGCLTATGSSQHDDDFSCGQKYSNGSSQSYCNDTFTLSNNLGTSKFYAKSGRTLIRKISNYIEIFDDKYDPVKINTLYLATAEVKRECIVFESPDDSFGTKAPDVNIYFNNKKLKVNKSSKTTESGKELYWYTEEIYHPKTCRKSYMSCSGEGEERTCERRYRSYDCSWYEYVNHYKYRYKRTFTYNYELDDSLNTLYLEDLSGKVYNKETKNATTKIVGIISKLNETSGSIPFRLVYGELDAANAGNHCIYQVEKEIIEPTPEVDKYNLNIAFREIDTTEPFAGSSGSGRKTNTNWCDGDDCGSKNKVVKENIINSINSYGLDSSGNRHEPKYKIVLTPQDIEIIRKYNVETEYDSNITTKKGGTELNAFVYDLSSGKINKYNESGTVVGSYGKLTNSLIKK